MSVRIDLNFLEFLMVSLDNTATFASKEFETNSEIFSTPAIQKNLACFCVLHDGHLFKFLLVVTMMT